MNEEPVSRLSRLTFPFQALVLLVGAALLLACGTEDVPTNTSDPAELIAVGEQVYQANCATCHGAAGEGQPNWKSRGADGLYPAPPHDPSGHTWHHPDEQLLDIIRRGGQAVYGSEASPSGMPAWGDRLTEQDIEAVLAYIKTMWGNEEREYQAALE